MLQLGSYKRGFEHPHNLDGNAINADCAVENPGIATEVGLPANIADNAYRMSPFDAVVFLVKQAPKRGPGVEELEIRTRHEFAVDLLGLVIDLEDSGSG